MSTVIRNRGLAGETLNGENTGLVSVEGGAVWFPGDTLNYLTVPDEAALDFTGDWGFVVKVAMDDWTSPDNETLIAKWDGITNRSYLVQMDAGNLLVQAGSGSSSANLFNASLGDLLPTNGTPLWIAASFDSTTGQRLVWTGGSGSAPIWVLFSDSTGAPFSLFSGNQPVAVGAYSTGSIAPLAGVVSLVQVFDGIGAGTAPGQGTKVLDIDLLPDITDAGATSFTASSGQTVTVNRATTGPVTTLVPAGKTILVNPDSTDVLNRIDIPESTLLDITATDDLFMAGVWYGWNDDPSSGTMWTSNSRTSLYGMYGNATNGIYGYCDGVTTTSASRINNDRLTAGGMIFMLRDTVNNTMRTAVWTVADGFLDDWTGAITPASATANADGYLNLAYAPAFAVAMERKGVGIAAEYDDTTLAALAAYLLEEV